MAEKQYIREYPEHRMEITGFVMKVEARQFKDGPITYSVWVMCDNGEIFVFSSPKKYEAKAKIKIFAGMKQYTAKEII